MIIPDLVTELKSLVAQIPTGRVATFGDIANALGDRTAARWVGEMVASGNLQDLPAHRIVLKTGELRGDQPILLAGEAVTIEKGRVALDEHRFENFQSDAPLQQLRESQDSLHEQIELCKYDDQPAEIAGVDLSYLNDGTAVACYALVETSSRELIWSHTVHRVVPFPYLSGYLAYRELPLLLDLLEEVRSHRELADVIMVDGNGYLHPRRAGIASHLGVATGRRTMGIGKKLLCGNVDLDAVTPNDPQPILHRDELIGMAMKSSDGSRPVFVSPGHRMDVESAARIAKSLFQDHRIPEPVYHADAISRRVAKEITESSDSSTGPACPPPQSL